MKKNIILIVTCIAFLAVFFVAFFGTLPENIEPIVYISNVAIKGMDGNEITNKTQDGRKLLMIDYKEEGKDADGVGYMAYFFTTTILPENSTSRAISYYLGSENKYISLVNDRGGALMIKPLDDPEEHYFSSTIYCKANDAGPNGVEDAVLLLVHYA